MPVSGLHGIHIHDFGDLTDAEKGTSTGPHYNPLDEIHGCYPTPSGENPAEARKVGDMGNVIVNSTGAGFYSESANEIIFLDGTISVMGRGVIVHAKEDNCIRVEGPGGDLSAGARIGFCVVGHAQADAATTAHRRYIRQQYALLQKHYNGGA
jgi:Cu/Zn superoxide dismutase